ncbi:hypothetical protein G6F35_017188 [Rhizopus arrhizus]|nr:hypothetical protein G6F31_018031 [Rhizopus arrhizus]KAG1170621.1 hypothetical protein G6F35_017188 [Rhizopus arrhizus]KAG1253595.1 hypothetical protein G6F68_011263 [Rhizopus microsporus]KAG1266406.1 hypothetical protein G6F65_014068 [Rhizopus arrhizus]
MIRRALERIARAHPAAEQVHRQVQRPQHQILVDVRALVVVQPDQRLHAPPGLMRIGAAGHAQVVPGMQDHIAQRDRPARPPRPVIEDECTVAGAPAQRRPTQQARQATDQADQRIGQRPHRAQHLQRAQPEWPGPGGGVQSASFGISSHRIR